VIAPEVGRRRRVSRTQEAIKETIVAAAVSGIIGMAMLVAMPTPAHAASY
jgi:hypothetical protein